MNNITKEQSSSSSAGGDKDQGRARFRGQILNRVYRVWLFRRLAPVLAAEIIGLSLVLYGLGRLVFVERVIQNGLNVFFEHPSGIVSFGIGAFLHAPVGTKLVAIAMVVLVAFIIRIITQAILRFILVRENYFRQIPK